MNIYEPPSFFFYSASRNALSAFEEVIKRNQPHAACNVARISTVVAAKIPNLLSLWYSIR
jgi:hypothetical protein